MHLTLRLVVAGVLVAVSHVLVLGIHDGIDPEPATLPLVGIDSLPKSIGDFTGHDEPLDERLVAASDADIMLNRVYRNRLGDFVVVNVGVWANYDKTIPHSPEGCYPAAGWEVASRGLLKLPTNGAEQMEVKRFVFQRGSSRIAVAFWVQLDDAAFIESEGIRQVRQRLRVSGGKLPPLVKVMLQTDAQDVTQAEARLSRFVENIRPFTRTICQ